MTTGIPNMLFITNKEFFWVCFHSQFKINLEKESNLSHKNDDNKSRQCKIYRIWKNRVIIHAILRIWIQKWYIKGGDGTRLTIKTPRVRIPSNPMLYGSGVKAMPIDYWHLVDFLDASNDWWTNLISLFTVDKTNNACNVIQLIVNFALKQNDLKILVLVKLYLHNAKIH